MATQRRPAAAATATARAADDDRADVSPLDPSRAAPEVVQLGLTGAIAGVALVGLTMCVLAGALALFLVWYLPPPGTRDVPTEMAWTRSAPFSRQHDYVGGLHKTGMTVLPSGAAHEDVLVGRGHTLSKGDFTILLFKMYLAAPLSPSAAAAAALPASATAPAPPPFPFIFARANEREALYATLDGRHHEVLPGVEAAIMGMRVGGRRKIVVPPHLAYGAEGFAHKTGMRTVTVPPNATLLYYVEVLRAGAFVPHEAHDEL